MKTLWWKLRFWLANVHATLYVRPSLEVYHVKWTEQNAKDLAAYLQSESGEHLQSVLLAYIQNTDHQAVGIATPRACGHAVGQRSLLANIIALSGHIPPQADETKPDELQGLVRQRNPYPEPGNEKPEHS